LNLFLVKLSLVFLSHLPESNYRTIKSVLSKFNLKQLKNKIMSKPVILCVDDERMVLDSLRMQLSTAFGSGYKYEAAEDAYEALDLIEELDGENIRVIVIISDWLMPGIKGDDFLIRVHEQFPKVVKIMLTGQADEAAINRAKKHANLHSCLFKPWSESDLRETILSALSQLNVIGNGE